MHDRSRRNEVRNTLRTTSSRQHSPKEKSRMPAQALPSSHKSPAANCGSERFYSTIKQSRNRRNLLRTKDRRPFYSTANRRSVTPFPARPGLHPPASGPDQSTQVAIRRARNSFKRKPSELRRSTHIFEASRKRLRRLAEIHHRRAKCTTACPPNRSGRLTGCRVIHSNSARYRSRRVRSIGISPASYFLGQRLVRRCAGMK